MRTTKNNNNNKRKRRKKRERERIVECVLERSQPAAHYDYGCVFDGWLTNSTV